jgi:Ran GTPase-activating protein (RanGAP) involved in mRNA processing and transport
MSINIFPSSSFFFLFPGLTAVHLKELQSGVDGNLKNLSVASLDLSQNKLEDKGLEILSDIIGNLNYGPVQLNLSNVSPSKKGIAAFCNALRKNAHMLVTLTTLDLSGNKFESDNSVAFCNWIASPNALVSLSLADTRINVDKLAGDTH